MHPIGWKKHEKYTSPAHNLMIPVNGLNFSFTMKRIKHDFIITNNAEPQKSSFVKNNVVHKLSCSLGCCICNINKQY